MQTLVKHAHFQMTVRTHMPHACMHARTHSHTYIHVCAFVCVCVYVCARAQTHTHTYTSYTLCVCGPGPHTHARTQCTGLCAHAHTMPIQNRHRLARAFARMLRRTSKRGCTLVFFIFKTWICSSSRVSRTGYSVLNFVYCCVNESL